jgi:hypothetical protein
MIAALSWPMAIVWVALILCLLGVPVYASGMKRSPADQRALHDLEVTQQATLDELRSIRGELAALRGAVDELDRVLKSVE